MKTIKLLLLVLFVALLPYQMALAGEMKTVSDYKFSDEGFNDHWASEEMENLLYADVVEGSTGHGGLLYVNPDEHITRAQFVRTIVAALGLSSDGLGKSFLDVEKGEWYGDSIRIASDLGLVDGDKGYFYPHAPITRAEITKIIVLAFENTTVFSSDSGKTFKDVTQDNWANRFIQMASSAHIINGYGDSFSPNQFATRAEAFVMLQRALQQELSELPEDADLTNVLQNYITREHTLVETNRFAEIADLDKEYGTGFYQSGGGDPKPFDWFYPAVEEAEITIEINDEDMQFKVLEKANRFAKVQVSGISVTIDAKLPSQPELNQNFTTQMDNGVYHLKKDSLTGKWKIYNYQDR
ncbi:S-layer homology domain-containing protein [Bacillus tuaregi]|uniref:S-layer homology domain-containing protein n=1 Tax=Bacillus tuaregi TaxID=1816695 RepID=UPI0008F8F40D|nr:S-layer homology domain-containing protein [Bacillus tuaregi]